MTKLIKSKLLLQVFVAAIVATLATTGIVAAATTIGTNINTGGTLDATGVTTLGNNLKIAPAYSLDVSSAGVLNIGTTTANAITIGKAGVTTTNAGLLTVTGAATLSSTLGVTGLATFSNNLKVAPDYGLDVSSAGVLNIGTTTANAITIGKAGVTTTNAGALAVTQATTLSATTTINATSWDGNSYPVQINVTPIGTIQASRQGALYIYSNRTSSYPFGASWDGNPDTGLKMQVYNRAANTTSYGAVRGLDITARNRDSGTLSWVNPIYATAEVSDGTADTAYVAKFIMKNNGVINTAHYGLVIQDDSQGTSPADTVLLKLATNAAQPPASGARQSAIKITTGTLDTGGFTYGLDMNSATIGTAEIRLKNAETISNGTNGSVTIANDAANTITLTPATGTITPSTGTININGIMSAATTTATTAMVVPVVGTAITDNVTTCGTYTAGALIYTTDAGTKGLFVCDGTVWQACMN